MGKSSERRQITVAEMAPHIHSFSPHENKADKIAFWLEKWIKNALLNQKIKPYDFLPAKSDLAFHIGVSLGTIQNAYRQLENLGLLESKQKIGTYIVEQKNKVPIIKLTSKYDTAIEEIKIHIKENNYHAGEAILPTKILAAQIGVSVTTLLMAINNLIKKGILEKKDNLFIVKTKNFEIKMAEPKTVAQKIADNIKANLTANIKRGKKLLSNSELAKKYNTSLKTIHDALKILSKEGVIITKRGNYGTYIVDSSSTTYSYKYEQTETKIKEYIMVHSDVGKKLPSIRQFSEMFHVSIKTVKMAIDNLSEEGFVTTARGKYGGIFVIDKPPTAQNAYTWLAINPNYISETDN